MNCFHLPVFATDYLFASGFISFSWAYFDLWMYTLQCNMVRVAFDKVFVFDFLKKKYLIIYQKPLYLKQRNNSTKVRCLLFISLCA